jgi:ADP-ribosyl-[dinitrogen reductase] hydrolase
LFTAASKGTSGSVLARRTCLGEGVWIFGEGPISISVSLSIGKRSGGCRLGHPMDLAERVVGSVLGLALGDALGAPFEFLRSRNVPDPLPAFERPWLGRPPGSTTDDTAMARNLVRSLTARNGFDPDDLVARHLRWYRSEPPDVGTLVGRVLRRVERGEDAAAAARGIWSERGPEVSAGNGSVMYCAPLGLAYANRPDDLRELAPALSALTHYDGRCRAACLAVTLGVAGLVRGESAEDAARSALTAVEDLEGGEELEFLVEAAGSSRAIDGPDQGFCLFTAGVAFQALVNGGDAETELRRVVSLGGDADTNAAVAGALLGARDGSTGLPGAWLAKLGDADTIRAEAQALVPLAQIR